MRLLLWLEASNSVSWTHKKVRSNKNNNEIKGIKTTETVTKTYNGARHDGWVKGRGSW